MATVEKWNPFGVALDITATPGTVTRKSATQFEVDINVSWETYYNGANTIYGMDATSGGATKTISAFNGTSRSSGSGSLKGTYSISGNGSATKTITVTFKNYNSDNGDSKTKAVSFNVTVPAWTSYSVKYNANGGSGAPSSQTKWKGQSLTLSSTKPTRTGYTFDGWATSAGGSKAYAAGGNYTKDEPVTLYAVWKAITYTVQYNANGGTGAPASQTKTYGTTLTLSSTKPTRTNYTFKGWGTAASATTVAYAAGASYTKEAAVTLYAIWELAYEKPIISDLTVARCNQTGIVTDDGTYALIQFNWKTSVDVYLVNLTWETATGEGAGTKTVSASGKSGTVSVIVGGNLNTEISYTFKIMVTDSSGNTDGRTDRSVTVSGSEYHLDFGENSVAVGKPAETLLDSGGKAEKTFDVKWRSKFRNHVNVGDKLFYHDGKQGIFLSAEGYMHLQRSIDPYIGFYLDKATSAGGQVRLNSSTKLMEFLSAQGYKFDDDVLLSADLDFITNNTKIFGVDENGVRKNAFQAQNESGNTIIGYGNWDNASGNTNIYGHDINFGVSNIAEKGTYRPYRRRGDSFSLTLRTAGYVTNGGKDVSFWIPMSEPIIGSPTVSITSGSGFVLRQGNAYTHGSGASTNVNPDSYEATGTMLNGIYVKAVFSNTTNVTNNDSIGIYWNGTITFS